MTNEEKQLLWIDLCSRLPYGVKVEITVDGGMMEASYDMKLDAGILADLLYSEDDFKPYLRPMSSMTEEEGNELASIQEKNLPYPSVKYRGCDYLNSIHVDYRGLIEKGLALEAPEDMYKTK